MEEKRSQWGTRVGFVLAAIGSAIGLGNIWRFPYMAYDNGGGAFLIPYFFALLTAGIPLLILEMGLGHKMRGSAPLSFRKIKEKYETVGWWAVIITFIVTVYYSVIISWAINYLFYAFNQSWGTETGAFFMGDFLKATGFWDFGGFEFNVLLGLIAVWGLNYFILYKGIKKGIEKASKVFMPILALLLVLITLRGITLPGSIQGLNHFLQPDFSVLLNPDVWIDAYGQVFFTLSLGFGIMIAYASYLPKKSDVVNNAFMTAFANSGFSFLAGLGVFGVLGYMAQAQGVPFEEVVSGGIGLAFVAFPKAINLLPAFKGIFGVLFFLSLVISGLSSTMSLIESFSSSIMDKFAMGRKKAITLVCSVGFLGSLIFATGLGIGILDVIDHFVMAYGLAVVGFVECIVIGHLWNINRIKNHVNLVSDFKVGNWWNFAIKYVTVLGLGYMLVYKLIREAGPLVTGNFDKLYGGYPVSAIVSLGWGVALGIIAVAYMMRHVNWNQNVNLSHQPLEEE
ncbi:sodium-dependent transporter [Halanaerobacter jeridensis]|uniref:Transporter n=1 Tax=Halanaerobacter jeridensis TaxID=706427 RepID=A0A938XN07_9FIRM|nr:sodium-dependent transporter [Halanaerobacter jeridensis]MBM7555253.1 NSS family neurotransmitter:Na+ symporter [Halanaerobacter jeridensis]